MARTIKPEEHAAKRAEILNAAMGLVCAKGYEAMTIGDILRGLGISRGAFYHYFDSKAALLEAFMDQIRRVTHAALSPIVDAPDLSAVDKLRAFFAAFDRMRGDNRGLVVELGQVWYGDANALVRQKVDDAVRAHRAPIVSEIVRQGIREGVFASEYPDDSGELVMSLIHGMAAAHARLLWQRPPDLDPRRCAERVAAIHAATMDAVERVIGARPGSLERIEARAVMTWVRLTSREADGADHDPPDGRPTS